MARSEYRRCPGQMYPLWAQRGLMKAQQLATAPQHDWLHLDTVQLLKHFLGLARPAS